MNFHTLKDLDLHGKRVLMRVDFNVPQDKATLAITNNQRIVSAMDVKSGDVWDAYLLLNYPDKREMIPWRALRVGNTQSNISTPKAIHSKILAGVPTPIR